MTGQVRCVVVTSLDCLHLGVERERERESVYINIITTLIFLAITLTLDLSWPPADDWSCYSHSPAIMNS